MGREKLSADYYKTLRARFEGREVKDTPPLEAEAPADPAGAWFGGREADDEPPAARRFDASGLRAEADSLADHITRRAGSQASFGAHTLRLLVGAVWLASAWWFLTRLNNGDGLALARLFAIIGVTGIGAALLGAVATSFAGRRASADLQHDAQSFGEHIGREAQALSDNLHDGYRSVEADVFLKSVAFADSGAAADEQFDHYLNRTREVGKGLRADALAAILALVAVAGLGVLFFGPFEARVPAIVAAYPLASALIGLGVVVYAAAGFIPLFGGRAKHEERIREKTLETVQVGFDAASPPSIESLSRRMRADAATSPTSAPTLSNHAPDATRDASAAATSNPSQNLDWRERDSAPQFVDTGFLAAPKAFRTEPEAKKMRREPEAKRSLFTLKKGARR